MIVMPDYYCLFSIDDNGAGHKPAWRGDRGYQACVPMPSSSPGFACLTVIVTFPIAWPSLW